MEFYFCEKCGKRVTAVDVAQGQAKNKKLRGVFCTECAEGVLTLETMALTDDAARAILDKNPTPSKPSAAVGVASSKAIRPAKARAAPAKPERSKAGVFAAAGAGLLAVVLLLAFAFGRSSEPKPDHAKAPTPALSVLDRSPPPAVPEPPAQKSIPVVTEREPARIAAPAVEPAVPAPVEPPVQASVETPVQPAAQPKETVEVKTEEPSAPVPTPAPAVVSEGPPLPVRTEAPAEGTFAKSAPPDEPGASKSASPSEAKTVDPPESAPNEDPGLREGLVFHQSFENVGAIKGVASGEDTSAPGMHGKAFRFNGQGHDAGGVILQGPHLKNTEQVSIALWIKRAAHASNPVLLENRHRYRLSLQATQVTWHWIQGETGHQLSAPMPVRAPETGWIHLAWTCDGKTALAYVNGRPAGQAQGGGGAIGRAQNSGYSLRIGGKFVTGTEKNVPTFDGWMDDLRVYHRVLNPKEVAALAKTP
ncbi:MAG: hypothetical protein AMXMBFR7_08210 [Planctomycetota bacterium]